MAGVRRSGVLLHPTSLPGAWGVGDLGASAIDLLDWLRDAGQSVWQILPIGPAGPGNSPYSGASAFAADPLLISPERLDAEGLLPPGALDASPDFPSGRVDYALARTHRESLLRDAWEHVQATVEQSEVVEQVEGLPDSAECANWLGDWTLYAALRRRFDGRPWQEWPEPLRRRDPAALDRARRELENEVLFRSFCQLLCQRQWSRVHSEARARGIQILGDVPIYVGLDSADTWAHQELFELRPDGLPAAEAGVPPDTFSDLGQSWGNPLYDWHRMAETDFSWWIDRLRNGLRFADVLRLDHFRGFEAYWEVPAGEEALEGKWVPGPGASLFDAVRAELGDLPLVAEDLGVITPEVRRLRGELRLPGTRVLQFGLLDPESEHLPHNLQPDVYLYTGTHDNPPLLAWFDSLTDDERHRALSYVGGPPEEFAASSIRAALTSVAEVTIFPMQDLLGLGDEATMNRPSVPRGNWEWRLDRLPGAGLARRLARMTELSARLPTTGASS